MLTIQTGGQTGVDRAVLDAVIKYNSYNNTRFKITVTGWCPKGRLAEDGTISYEYPLNETPTEIYPERTRWNIRDANATLIISMNKNEFDSGTELTIQIAIEMHKLLKYVYINNNENINVNILEIIEWIDLYQISILNIAGPRESRCHGIYVKTYEFILKFLKRKFDENENL